MAEKRLIDKPTVPAKATAGRYVRWWALAMLVLVPLILGIGMMLSVGRTGTLQRTLFSTTQVQQAADEFRIRFDAVTQALSTFMFLGSDSTWLRAQTEQDQLIDTAQRLANLTARLAPKHRVLAASIMEDTQGYQAHSRRLKDIRQDPGGVVAGVLASSRTQAEQNYGFTSALATALGMIDQEPELASAKQQIDLMRAYALWNRAIAEFRAQLLIRNEPSLTDLYSFLETFERRWAEIVTSLQSYAPELRPLLREADEAQENWNSALSYVLETHRSRRWREDLRYVEDVLQPISQQFLGNLARLQEALREEQQHANEQLIDNERNVFLWASAAMLLGTALALALLLFFYRLLQEQEKRRMAAEEANLMKTEFLSNVSHELRTPLNSILGFSELMKLDEAVKHNGTLQEQVNYIHTSGAHLLTLINDILDLTMIEGGRLKLEHAPVDLHQLISTQVETLRINAKDRAIDIEIDCQLDPELPQMLVTDARRLQQVLINLLWNAIKFNKEAGRIWVRCRNDATQQRLYVEVEDTGIGIPPEHLEYIFEPFQQVDSGLNRRHEGAGIGLAVTRRLIELMGGHISVASTPGQGSTFTFWLPTDSDPTTVQN